MGIVNVTPDSFSDGGKYATISQAVAHAKTLIQQGADIIDIGGESTRPGAQTVSEQEEINRVIPVIETLHDQVSTPLSIDTTKAEVARQSLQKGACFVNDVSALQKDKHMVEVVSDYQVPICLMHMKGNPQTMQINPVYDDVIEEIKAFFNQRIKFALAHNIQKKQIILDPGIGFGKRTGKGIEDNCVILRRLQEFTNLGYPILVGASRKTFIGKICGEHTILPPSERLEGSLAAACVAMIHGADIIRVHDVKETIRCRDIITCIMKGA